MAHVVNNHPAPIVAAGNVTIAAAILAQDGVTVRPATTEVTAVQAEALRACSHTQTLFAAGTLAWVGKSEVKAANAKADAEASAQAEREADEARALAEAQAKATAAGLAKEAADLEVLKAANSEALKSPAKKK